MTATFSYLYSYYFFLFWLPTYMIQARGFTEAETKLSALPFVLGCSVQRCGRIRARHGDYADSVRSGDRVL